MAYTVKQIADAIGADHFGDGSLVVSGVSEPAQATERDIALAMKPDYAQHIATGAAKVAFLWPDADWQSFGLKAAIIARRPRYALAGLSAMLDRGQAYPQGIHPTAFVDQAAAIGKNVTIGAFTCIAAGAVIGDDCVIGPQCYVGVNSTLGAHSLLREGVKIGADVRIGAHFIAQPSAIIGGDGFSFVTPEVSAVEKVRETLGDQGDIATQSWARIHSLGGVDIGENVEVGANTCIDRGSVRPTKIGNGVKIDNLTQIGHNVIIGNDCLICAQVGIAGSTRIGNNVVLGGQTGVSDNVFIGDNVITGGATKVLSNIPAGRVMLGYPAMKMETHIEIYKSLRKLPRLLRDVTKLQKAIFNTDKND